MKVYAALFVSTLLLASCTSQQPGGGGMPQQGQGAPNFMQALLYRNFLDMNWLPAMALSNNFGRGGQTGGLGSIWPYLYLFN